MDTELLNRSQKLWPITHSILFLLMILGCGPNGRITGTVDDTDTGISAMLYNPDGSPAVGAKVMVFNAADTTKLPVFEGETDNNGNYSVVKLSNGIYNIYAEKDSLVAFQDSVRISKGASIVKKDTLEPQRSVTAIVGLQPNHDPRTVTVQVLGTHIYSNVNEKGYFRLNKMATGNYVLKLSTTLDGYTTTFEEISVDAGTPDTLTDTLWLIYTGIPVVHNMSIVYDTLNGIVRLNWKPTSYYNLQDYLIYRDHFDSVNLSSLPIASSKDTFFCDSIFDRTLLSGPFSFSDTNDYHFKYRVIIRNNSQDIGLSYKYSDIVAASPTTVQTVFRYTIYHKTKGFITDTMSTNDSVEIKFDISNPGRVLLHIGYRDLVANKTIDSIAADSLDSFRDTITYSWPATGEKQLEIYAVDDAGTYWKDTIQFIVIDDKPKIVFPDTLVYLNTAIIIKSTDRFGKVTNLTALPSKYVESQTVSDSVLRVTIKDTLTNRFPLVLSIRDDDGNMVIDTLHFRTSVQWEKVADTFLGDNQYVRNAVVFNDALFALVYTKNENKNSLYYSNDGISWDEAVGETPWIQRITILAVHNDKLWLMEGANSETVNKIWYSGDGRTWNSQQLYDFPKWNESCNELMFLSFKGKLWAGVHHFYGVPSSTEFWQSTDGLTWTDVDTSLKPINNSKVYPSHYYADNNSIWYTVDETQMCTAFLKTNDFIHHELMDSWYIMNSGSSDIPVPVRYLNRILVCSSEETTYKGLARYSLDGIDWDQSFSYPGSKKHYCVVFKNRLYSISNNGIYATR